MAGDTLQTRFRERLERDPGGRAILFPGQKGEAFWQTYADVYGQAGGTALAMIDLGVKPGHSVLIVLPSGEPAARLVLGALLAGARPLLIAPPGLLGPSSDLALTLARSVRKTRAKLVVLPTSVDRESLELGPATVTVGDDRGLVAPPATDGLPTLATTGDDLVAYQLTSGTTGFARICAWRNSAVIGAVEGMTEAMGVTTDDVFVNWTPLYHDMGLVNNYITCLLTGIPLVMMNPHSFVKSPASWLTTLSKTKATVTWSPNFGFALAAQRIKDEELEGVDLSHVTGFWNAAERIHLETMEQFFERFAPYGVRREALKTNFGCAENIGGATFTEIGEPFSYEHVDRKLLYERRLARPIAADSPEAVAVVGAGKPHSGVKITILNSRGRTLSDGEVGEVALDTVSQMEGYLGDAAATKKALRYGLLRTGDLGYLRDDELYWVGRSKERITVRGRKFDPSDFERLLYPIKGLRTGSFAAFGLEDPESGTERVVIVAEVADPLARPATEIMEEIRLTAMKALGLSVEPTLVAQGTLTKTSSGKRRHRHFKRLYQEGTLPNVISEGIS